MEGREDRSLLAVRSADVRIYSLQIALLTKLHPEDFDDLVLTGKLKLRSRHAVYTYLALTGFSASTASMKMATIAFSLTLAATQSPIRFGMYDIFVFMASYANIALG